MTPLFEDHLSSIHSFCFYYVSVLLCLWYNNFGNAIQISIYNALPLDTQPLLIFDRYQFGSPVDPYAPLSYCSIFAA